MATPSRTFLLTLILISACDRQELATTPSLTARNATTAAAVTDDAMGELSFVAQYIVAALQDSSVRFRLAAAMQNPSFSGSIIDLQDCAGRQGSLVADLLAAGERRGLGSAIALCEELKARPDVTLYMSPNRAAKWDPVTIPIVTAIASNGSRRQGDFKGYLSPSQTIDLPDDGRIGGPILVVLGQPHPNRLKTLSPRPPNVEVRNAPPGGMR